jgi:mannose-6-phosphate isomerase-like protein (cupin superfamily)
VGFYVVQGEQLDWEPYERYRRRHRAAVTEVAALRHTRANFIRHEPGEKGPRHIEPVQAETFIPVRGTLTMYLGEPPERHEIPVGGLVHVEAGTAQQIVNETDEEILVFIYGAPPQRGPADVIKSAV